MYVDTVLQEDGFIMELQTRSRTFTRGIRGGDVATLCGRAPLARAP